MTPLEKLVEQIRAFEAPNVFNPWSASDPYDIPDATGGPEGRCRRLEMHFSIERPRALLIGEAPGYQGCHFSGVAFTHEKLIMQGRIPRITATGRLTTRRLPCCEPSATIVWGMLHQLGLADHIVMWNAFAYHPHKPGDPWTNRAPTATELKTGRPVLEAVLNYFGGVPVVPVGRVSERILQKLGVPALPAVRHPSMAGAELFRSGMKAAKI